MTEQDPLAARKADLDRQLRDAQETLRLSAAAAEILRAANGAEVHVDLPGLSIHTYPNANTTE